MINPNVNATAVIIARGGSKRLPNKNMKLFHGKPLVVHKVLQLLRCRHVAAVVVGSDSEEILSAAREAGADTRLRAPEYCDEVSRSWNQVIVDMALRVPGETILWAHCTNPCIRPETYDRALETYKRVTEDEIDDSTGKLGDSVISVTAFRGHAWGCNYGGDVMMPLNHAPWEEPHCAAADLEPVYFQNGGIFIYNRHAMIRDRYVYGKRPAFFQIEYREAIDIDNQEDFDRAVVAWDWTS